MKKVLCALLVVCLCLALIACSKPDESVLRQQLTNLVSKDAIANLNAADYYRVAIDTLEKDGKNQWKAEGNVSFTESNGITIAVLYISILRYDPGSKTYTTDTTFGDAYPLYS